MATNQKDDPIRYLIRWAGIIVVSLIASCGIHNLVEIFVDPKTCASQVLKMVDECMVHGATIDDRKTCMESGAEMLKECPVDAKNE